MRLHKCLRHAFMMVVHSKLRSWLTILGIVIGVAAVIAIVSIGEGMQADINSRLGSLGGDIVTVSAGFSRGGDMFGPRDRQSSGGSTSGKATTEEVVVGRSDVQVLRGMPELSIIETEIRGNVNVSFLGKSGRVSLTGVDQKVWSQITTLSIRDGRFLDAADQNVVVVGARLADTFFSQPLGINKMITVEGSSYRIVGILDDQSTSIYMPINMAYQVLDDKSVGTYDSIIVKVKDESQLDSSIASMQQRLMLSRHVTNKTMDFSVTSSKQMQETRAAAMSSINTFLLAIAGVSLIVGAVGVANTMFTSVIEKTKEIGIMKAIGARNRDILLIFVMNSALIGLVGGLIGIVFGGILSGLLPSLMGSTPFVRSTLVSMNSVIMAVVVSVGVGILAGIVPAYQASRLKPVDALRFE